jgi:hypothetical protein
VYSHLAWSHRTAVIPLALIAGQARGGSLGWGLVNCSFGIFGAIPLLLSRRYVRQLKPLEGLTKAIG